MQSNKGGYENHGMRPPKFFFPLPLIQGIFEKEKRQSHYMKTLMNIRHYCFCVTMNQTTLPEASKSCTLIVVHHYMMNGYLTN